jgi:hypothetical protein
MMKTVTFIIFNCQYINCLLWKSTGCCNVYSHYIATPFFDNITSSVACFLYCFSASLYLFERQSALNATLWAI